MKPNLRLGAFGVLLAIEVARPIWEAPTNYVHTERSHDVHSRRQKLSRVSLGHRR